jgi:hypothetical protein
MQVMDLEEELCHADARKEGIDSVSIGRAKTKKDEKLIGLCLLILIIVGIAWGGALAEEEGADALGQGRRWLPRLTFPPSDPSKEAGYIPLVGRDFSLEYLYSSSFKLGGDVAIAAGPIGGGASAKAAGFKADYFSYTRAKGAFLGFSLEGAVVEINDEWNQAYYGGEARPTDIFVTRGVNNPKANQTNSLLPFIGLFQLH